MTIGNLQQAFPSASYSNLEKYYSGIILTIATYDLNTVNRQAAFLAQCAHESMNFAVVVENLNYSKEALVRVWPKYFPTIEIATPYHRNPEKIANRAYANRMGNGDEASGDGWKFRGRGFIQVTGKNNYTTCGKALNIDLLSSPDLLQSNPNCVLSAGWFWDTNSLNSLADKDDIVTITKRINGGILGLDDRKKLYENAKSVLKSTGIIS